jgi:DNA-binding NarL/FixJ family response regulator
MRVLLAAKNYHLRVSLELFVSEEPGMQVVGAVSETEGLQALIKTTHPDLVILDWELPGRQLCELLEDLRRKFVAAKFIVLGMDGEDRDNAMESGAHAFVLKASPPEYLLNAMRGTHGVSEVVADRCGISRT